ncbi:ribosomal RNA-processing protein RRP42 [Methanosarcina thermophila]|jgi:exosome complex component RRP42|uniref:Exosome complex component Rrp42 n=4 Tax=Methanosarcina thermophila TaxID=2210 RepID=A0A1I6Z1J8_METTE|nr:putative exosome complex exonuclease 2 [Methanosarcina thermophila TM-1]AKB14731.1 putative exosome complex exonuclease 2 [Methanosarcina thermophila CHTI-55]BAW29714.1 exosome complex RNA-binding protein Rrp42 [Methanosarcina thermophila]GLI14733.1 RNA-binding protein [Methanosarcina thermophila MST-A1]SFT56552.1 ribosomal RNA-processing protein RRP42 [Methanosarcina thermophila]
MSEVIATLKKDYIYNLMIKGKRQDGRGFKDFRDIKLETNVIAKAEGSAKVTLGNTQVLVGVKLQTGTPFPDSQDEGVIITNLELNPIASPEFEPGPPREEAIEMARVVDRGIRESGAIDIKKLCITVGESVWIVFIDVHVLNDDGNIIDASCLAAIAALMTTIIPNEQQGIGPNVPLPMKELPVGVTLAKIGSKLMVDPSLDEEAVCETKLTVVSGSDGAVVGMQKMGSAPLTEAEVLEAIDIACEKAAELRELYLKDLVRQE